MPAEAVAELYRTVNVKLRPLPQPQLRAHIHTVCSRVCTLYQDRTKILLLSHKFINDMINSTSLNEVH
jgi:hypothetical protein